MKKQEKKSNEKPKQEKKTIVKNISEKRNILLSIISLVIVFYLLYTIYLLIKQPTNVFTVEEGKLYKEETDIGYVIRNEKVVIGENYKNGMEQIKAEGERAAVNEDIFRYYSSNEENLKVKISELDNKIQEICKNYPVYICGDFNAEVTWNDNLEPLVYNYKCSLDKCTNKSVGTVCGFGKPTRINLDLCFYKNTEIDSSHILTDSYNNKYLSDHYPVLINMQ